MVAVLVDKTIVSLYTNASFQIISVSRRPTRRRRCLQQENQEMPKKNVAVYQSKQLGFGFDICDVEGRPPAFLWQKSEVAEALSSIRAACWASIDVETTGLTEASMPVDLTAAELRQSEVSNKVRLRTIQARVPTRDGRDGDRIDFAFDADRMGPELTRKVAHTILTRRMFIAHNAGFDLYWLRRAEGRKVMPEIVADTMLLTRLLAPELVLERAFMLKDVRSAADAASAEEQAAWKSLISGASGGSLADVVLAMFGVVVDKTYQKPNNWTGLLGFEHYEYAIDDVVWADRILAHLLGTEKDQGDLLTAYLALRERKPQVSLVESQVPDVVRMREVGMPFNPLIGENYAREKTATLAKEVERLVELEPTLAKHSGRLADPDAGLDDPLKKALAVAFEARGVMLRRTAATSAPQVGEKDLRACMAAKLESSRDLFKAWVAVCKAKKLRQMALETMGFAKRGDDGKLRSLISHGPVTGRLAAAEPNCQQWPRDQLFRAMCISPVELGQEEMELLATDYNLAYVSRVAVCEVRPGERVVVDTAWAGAVFYSEKSVQDWPNEARAVLTEEFGRRFTHVIVASDFGALDVRVGAALCVRAQREMLALAAGTKVPGKAQPPSDIRLAVERVARALEAADTAALAELEGQYSATVRSLKGRLAVLSEQFDREALTAQEYFGKRREISSSLLAARLGARFAQCMGLALARGERDYSALRDAFVQEIDIHTFTGMKLVGRDPMKEFSGLSREERKALEKHIKHEIGPRRQQGKIANLSLLYGMMAAGFQEAAARGYDEHWELEEAAGIRELWMDSYPEVELWHLWTESLQEGVVYLPTQGSPKPKRTGWWRSRTLGGREIVAFGLNAALSYQDQSSGADILGTITHTLEQEHEAVFATSFNQVHDEQVFCIPKEHHHAYLKIIEQVMVECANRFTMPYGVPCAVSPAAGPIWVKD